MNTSQYIDFKFYQKKSKFWSKNEFDLIFNILRIKRSILKMGEKFQNLVSYTLKISMQKLKINVLKNKI